MEKKSKRQLGLSEFGGKKEFIYSQDGIVGNNINSESPSPTPSLAQLTSRDTVKQASPEMRLYCY